eukprot:726220-Prymnesium_polylepis.1
MKREYHEYHGDKRWTFQLNDHAIMMVDRELSGSPAHGNRHPHAVKRALSLFGLPAHRRKVRSCPAA